MCGRFALFSSKKKILDDLFIKKENINNFSANYNISPTQKSPILLNQKGQKIFNEIFEIQKKRIYKALLNSKSDEVLNFDIVLSRIING